jgi:hypothetical protein
MKRMSGCIFLALPCITLLQFSDGSSMYTLMASLSLLVLAWYIDKRILIKYKQAINQCMDECKEKQARQQTEEANDRTNAIHTLCQSTLPLWQKHISTARVHSEKEVDKLCQEFANLLNNMERIIKVSPQTIENQQTQSDVSQVIETNQTELVDALPDQRHTIKNSADLLENTHKQIHLLLASLQFQDRTSQMLNQVEQDINSLVITLTEEQWHNFIDVEAWLQKMKKSYTMPEQHDNHLGITADNSEYQETTFF